MALEAALRLRRATLEDVDSAVARFGDFFAQQGRRHFEIEEELLLPAGHPDERWADMSARVLREHELVRGMAERLLGGSLTPPERVEVANELGVLLQEHVRFEERELFELLEELLESPRLSELGRDIERAEGASG